MAKSKKTALKGVAKKPFTINFIALIHTFAPISLVAYSFTINGYRYLNPTHWAWLFSIENTIFLLISPFIAIGIFVSHLIGWILSLLFLIAIVVSVSLSFFLDPGSTFTLLEYLVFIITNIIIIGALASKETRKPFFNPKLQWWKHDPRAKVSLKTVIENSRHKIEGVTHDISKSGLYLVSNETVEQNEPFRVLLSLEEHNTVEIEAKVIWINTGLKTNVPQGFGMRFVEVDKSIRNELKKLIKTEKKEQKSS